MTKPTTPRIGPKLAQEWRDKIKVSQLLNMLQAHATGQARMTPTRIRAAEILLKKCLPDLASMEYKGELTENVRYVADMPVKDATTEDWLEGNPKKPSTDPAKPTTTPAKVLN